KFPSPPPPAAPPPQQNNGQNTDQHDGEGRCRQPRPCSRHIALTGEPPSRLLDQLRDALHRPRLRDPVVIDDERAPALLQPVPEQDRLCPQPLLGAPTGGR